MNEKSTREFVAAESKEVSSNSEPVAVERKDESKQTDVTKESVAIESQEDNGNSEPLDVERKDESKQTDVVAAKKDPRAFESKAENHDQVNSKKKPALAKEVQKETESDIKKDTIEQKKEQSTKPAAVKTTEQKEEQNTTAPAAKPNPAEVNPSI
jgi:hypothetical protein